MAFIHTDAELELETTVPWTVQHNLSVNDVELQTTKSIILFPFARHTYIERLIIHICEITS